MTEEERAAEFRRWCAYGVPPREVKLVMNGLAETTPIRFVRDWLDGAHKANGPTMLVLAGPKGVGKTVAAAYAMMKAEPEPPPGFRVWPSDKSPRFRHVSEIAELGLYGKDEERKARGEIKNTKCLVVDDVGVEYLNDAFLALWDSIVNHRYGQLGFTIFTTNLTHEQFATRYGARVFDRIRGRGEWFDIDGESLRGQPVP